MGEYKKSILEYQDVRDAVDYAREEGREEERILMAQNCLKEDIPIETISKPTGLSKKSRL